MLSWIEHEKKFNNLGARYILNTSTCNKMDLFWFQDKYGKKLRCLNT